LTKPPTPTEPVGRHPVVRYMGFRATPRGREYTLSVADVEASREFVLLISHQAFAEREARFQDGPDVCSAKLRRELAADPDLPPGEGIKVTAQDLLDYRNSHLSTLEKRARSK
jgi:hypothetical protein